MRSAYELGITDWSKEVSHDIHKKIVTAFKTSEPLPWPPRAHDLHDPNEEIPSEVLQYILHLICGDKKPSYREESLASSISQDICRALTSGQWKMKKHILLCMTVRHLFRSKSITTLINRLGHCESYTYSIELETAPANSIVESASLVSNSDVIKRQPDGSSTVTGTILISWYQMYMGQGPFITPRGSTCKILVPVWMHKHLPQHSLQKSPVQISTPLPQNSPLKSLILTLSLQKTAII